MTGTTPMRVDMYSPKQMYGFAVAEGLRVFFHLESFMSGTWEHSPPPIVGEMVMVGCMSEQPDSITDRAPRAQVVQRVDEPIRLSGVVESFNPNSGWGFTMGSDRVSYYLHRSEVEAGRLPLPKQAVTFFPGSKNGKPRACYVEVGALVG